MQHAHGSNGRYGKNKKHIGFKPHIRHAPEYVRDFLSRAYNALEKGVRFSETVRRVLSQYKGV